MAGVRTPLKQFASCVLVDTGDSLGSIFSSDMAIGRYVAQRAGIRINAGRIRGIGSKSEAAKCNTQELSHSLKSLKAQLDVVHKTVSEVEAQLYTSLYGTKKSKISLSSKIIKALKTTVLGN